MNQSKLLILCKHICWGRLSRSSLTSLVPSGNTPASLSVILKSVVGNSRLTNQELFSLKKNRIALFSTTSRCSAEKSKDPEGKEYDYDEEKHEEYEKDAKDQVIRVRQFKKIFSSLLFATTLLTIMYARRQKKSKIDENLALCVFLPKDENFQGSYNLFCRYGKATNSPVLPVSIVKDGTIKAVKMFEVRPDDVFVASFPKTGTTWVQEITYRIKTENFEESSDILENRFPFLEYPYPGISTIEKQKSPRFIKTHLTYDLLPKDINEAKIIYVTRNPKDTVVSYYHFARMLTFSSYKGTFEEFLDKFKKGELPYTPFFGHVDGYTAHKEDSNVLVVNYEALTKDPASVVRKIGLFLDKPLSDEEVDKLVEGTSFEQMKNNPGVNYEHWDELGLRNKEESPFMRKGVVGDWRRYFNARINKDFDLWEKENNVNGLLFEYEM